MNQHSNIYQTAGGPATDLPIPPDVEPEKTLGTAEWGMLSFLLSEVAFFCTLIVAYVLFKGRDTVGPTPGEVLSLKLVLVTTAMLLASSVTVHLATHSIAHGRVGPFRLWWGATIALGIGFLAGTAYEWYGLIVHDHLTISRNLFGTTFYTLVGFHAFHVSMGVLAMTIVMVLVLRNRIGPEHALAPHLISWYWHFVDVVWLVVFVIVYLS